jgi:chromosome segregation ATPase
MEEEVKKHLLGLIPKKVGMLMARHRECAEKFPSFWQTFPERFAKKFEEEPEETLERFLALSNEECAWEKEDFMYRDLHLDNFIGREIARELKLELDQMEDIQGDKPKPEEILLQENIRLKKGRDRIQERLSACEKEKAGLEKQVRDLEKDLEEGGAVSRAEEAKKEAEEKLAQAERRLKEGEEKAEELERYAKGLEERLKRCLRKREPKKLARMARILELGSEVGGFVPMHAASELGIKISMVYEYLKELSEMGVVERVRRGYYRVKEKPEGDVEEELARRLAEKKEEGR